MDMTLDNRPLIVSEPYPKTLDLIFSPERKAQRFEQYRILEMESEDVNDLNDDIISEITYIIGQPPLDGGFMSSQRVRYSHFPWLNLGWHSP
jgi:hypothetical protein